MRAKMATSLLVSAATLVGCAEQPLAPSEHLPDPSLAAALAPTDVLAGQLIAFASDRDGTGFQVLLMQANGTKQTQLTHVPGYNARPNWSHDGRRITFTACRPTDFSCDIYVMNADGSAQTNLTHDFSTDQMSVWSPDDRRIAFVSDRDGTPQIYVMNADGSNVTRLTFDGALDFLPTWSPDGTRLALQTSRDGNDEVYVMNANGSNPVNLTNNPSTDGFPAWSPRGDKIAFRSDRDGNGEIYVMNVDGSGQTNLTHNPAEEYYPAWSPTGVQIAFVSDRDGNFEIYGMKPDGSLQTRLTSNPAFDADPAWAITATAGPAAPGACPAHADFVVSDERSLLSAVASAQPHDTIALNGMVEMTFADVFVETDDLTFTCATPGSGLRAAPAAISWLFVVLSKHVTVERLTLDASNTGNGGVVAFNGVEGPFTGFAEDVRLVGNHVLCAGQHVEACVSIRTDAAGLQGVLISGNTFEADGNQTTIALIGVNSGRVEGNTIEGGAGGNSDPMDFIAGSGGRFTRNNVQCVGACLVADGSPGLVVAANQFQSAGSTTGVHLQGGTDGDSVMGNTIVATAASTAPNLGAIRVRDGTNVVVADNTVRGPWANAIAATDLTGSDFERNSLQSAALYGIRLSSGVSFVPISMTSNSFRGNDVTGSGSAGMLAQLACNNQFIGNALQGNAGNVGAVFDVTTGANTLVGDGTIVVDNGSFDCNGDGVPDPNVITGLGPVRRGVPFAAPGGGATTTRRGIALQ